MEEFSAIDAVSCWSHRTTYQNGEYYDTVIIYTHPNHIKIECSYKKNKALTYNENLKDSTYTYTPSIKFIEIISTLKNSIPSRYKKAHQSALFL